jgi:hypothetical protein
MPSITTVIPLKSLAVVFDGGVIINVKYDPTFLTPEIEDEIMSIPDGERGDANKKLMGIYENLIMEWDLTSDDAKPIDTNAEALYRVPFAITNKIIQAIREDMRGNETSDE